MSHRHSIIALAMVGALAAGTGALGEERKSHDHDAVRAAMQRGEVLPLVKILAIATGQVAGDVIEVELDTEDKTLVYEIKILTSNGRVREVEIDARTGAVLKIEDD